MGIYTKAQSLANDLAKALNDRKHFGFYARLAKRHPEIFLRGILANCQEVKNWAKIENKGAYFTKTLSNYGQQKLNF